MRRRPCRRILEGVDSATMTVKLELQIRGESLSGRATSERGEVLDFDGWLGFLAAIDALVLTTVNTSPRRSS
jgi:hypothetical protein